MDGPYVCSATLAHLFGTIIWNWWRHLAFCIYHNNVRHTLANANAAREPYSRVIR